MPHPDVVQAQELFYPFLRAEQGLFKADPVLAEVRALRLEYCTLTISPLWRITVRSSLDAKALCLLTNSRAYLPSILWDGKEAMARSYLVTSTPNRLPSSVLITLVSVFKRSQVTEKLKCRKLTSGDCRNHSVLGVLDWGGD